jgi:hypothetical protein
MKDLFADDLFKQWQFQDKFEETAIVLVESGAHLGAIALAREILTAQIQNGNRTLRHDELLILIDKVKNEVKLEAIRGLKNARES